MLSFLNPFVFLAEHLLSLAFHVLDTYKKFGKISGRIYYVYVFPQIFQLLSYSAPLATFAQVKSQQKTLKKALFIIDGAFQYVSFISTVTWNYNDLFIIIVSMILTARFKQISDRMQRECDVGTIAEIWHYALAFARFVQERKSGILGRDAGRLQQTVQLVLIGRRETLPGGHFVVRNQHVLYSYPAVEQYQVIFHS